ncbi:MAG TPA: hypothetical protein VKB72_09125 [Steroidobacteraceae bacterium]|nr:hypothetical protein [Steroidobacteraceae bacterium]
MFIFKRRLSAVTAGLAVALLTVIIDSSCQPRDSTAGASLVAEQPAPACAAQGACGIVRAGS